MTERKIKIQQQLQRSFSVLKKCLQTWKEAKQTVAADVEKIANFTEQYQCCAKVDVVYLPIGGKFPDLQEKLLFKIACEADGLFVKIQKQLDTMKECSDKVTRQYDNCFKTYNKLSTVEEVPSICQRTVTSPSIADMLEWLQTSEMLLRQQYLCKQQLVRMFSISDESSTEMFVKEWAAGDTELIDEIEGYLSYTSFFLEGKI